MSTNIQYYGSEVGNKKAQTAKVFVTGWNNCLHSRSALGTSTVEMKWYSGGFKK